MVRIRIDVDSDDIQNGERCRTGKCPVALATIRVLRDEINQIVEVYSHELFIMVNEEFLLSLLRGGVVDRNKSTRIVHIAAPLPESAAQFIRRFDQDRQFTNPLPFSFTVEVVDEYARFFKPEAIFA